jgi:hypothetical protein
MGSVLFSRDASPSGNAPDLRPHVCLVHKDEPKVAWEPASPAAAPPELVQPTTQPATAKRKGLTLPKIGSLFGRSNKSDTTSSQGNKVAKGGTDSRTDKRTDVHVESAGATPSAAQSASTDLDEVVPSVVQTEVPEIVSDAADSKDATPCIAQSESTETMDAAETASDATETVGMTLAEIASDSTDAVEMADVDDDDDTHDFSPPAIAESPAPRGELDFSTSGVTGLVSKLEQQSTKAVTRLESCADEIQQRLVAELARLKAETHQRQNDHAADLESLAGNLSRKIIDTTADVENEIARTAGQHFDALNSHQNDGNSSLTNRQLEMVGVVEEAFAKLQDQTNTIVDSIRRAMNQLSQEELAKLESLFSESSSELAGLYPTCEKTLDAAVNGFQDKRQPAHASAKAAVDNRFTMFKRQLEEINDAGQTEIDQLKDSHANQLEREFTLSEGSMVAMRSSALQQEVLPRLKKHGEAIDTAAAELHQELSDELAQKAKDKLAEFEPLLVSWRKEIDRILSEVRASNDSMQDDARRKLQQLVERLDESVSTAIVECNKVAASTEAHLAGIDRAVRGLADRSDIEGDLALLNRRTEAWSNMEKATRNAQEEVLNAMRDHLSALDENGKHLQDDLVSTMEKGELELRRFAGQSFASIKGVVREAYQAIQNAQNEQMQI